MDELSNKKGSLKKLDSKNLELTGMFPIGDITVRKINVDFNFQEVPDLQEMDFIGATQRSLSKLLPNFVFKTANKKTEIEIGFRIAVPSDSKVKDLIYFMNENRNDIITTLSHEIQHSYFSKKSKYEPVARRAGYEALTKFGFAMIQPLNDFLYHSYFIHEIENIVRPTELATRMELEGVTRSQFLDFLKKTEAYGHLNDIRNFTYEKLKSDLTSYTSLIKTLLTKLNIDTDDMSDEQMIDETLRLFLVNLTNMKGDTMKKILTTDPFEIMFGFSGEKEKFFDRYIRYITKFGEDYEAFFRNEEKRLPKIAQQVIKKLGKVYSLAKKDSQ